MATDCKEYLKALSTFPQFYKTIYYLLEHGQSFTQVNFDISRNIRKHCNLKTKECYYNCQQTVLFTYHSNLIYFEGVAKGLIPVDHAWLVNTETGMVIDPTWEISEDREYFGIPIPIESIKEAWFKENVAKQLLWEYLIKITKKERDNGDHS